MKRVYDTLFIGDLAPWFRQSCIGREGLYSFDMAAGRHVVLCFYGAASNPAAQQALTLAEQHTGILDGKHIAFFGVSNDTADAPTTFRHFADADGAVSRAFGVAPREGAFTLSDLRRLWFVLDPRLRVIAAFPLGDEGNAAVFRYLSQLPTENARAQVPVLLIPGVFELEFCQRLMHFCQAQPSLDSAILTESGAVSDHGFKRRQDCMVADKALAAQIQTRIFRRVVPEIRHVFQFSATRLERMILACYDAADEGRFGPHRDNTIAETAHRRFAVSINLNDDFEGGDLVFPEYGSRPFRPALGGALVFSCSLLHTVLPMTRGRRYACLPFVYDDAAAELRRRNRASISAERQPSPAAKLRE
jgi:predicted 2-oxoglutarate/Fe(II)-dependent dioxygenase YbiX/peroxiredoxin